MKSEMKLDGS